MAVAFGSAASDCTTATSDTSIDITAPTGITVGDVLIAIVACVDARTISSTLSWTQEANNTDTTSRIYVFSKVADSADAAASTFTFTVSATFNNASGSMYRLTGGTTTGIVTAFSTGTNAQSITCPNITTTADASEVIWGAYQPTNAGPASTNRGTERVDQSDATSGTWIYGATEDIATAGSQTGDTITKTAFGIARGCAVAVAPPSGTTVTYPRLERLTRGLERGLNQWAT